MACPVCDPGWLAAGWQCQWCAGRPWNEDQDIFVNFEVLQHHVGSQLQVQIGHESVPNEDDEEQVLLLCSSRGDGPQTLLSILLKKATLGAFDALGWYTTTGFRLTVWDLFVSLHC